VKMLRHRRIVSRENLAELERAYLQYSAIGFEIDHDFNHKMTLPEILLTLHTKKQPVQLGVIIELPENKIVRFMDGEPQIVKRPVADWIPPSAQD